MTGDPVSYGRPGLLESTIRLLLHRRQRLTRRECNGDDASLIPNYLAARNWTAPWPANSVARMREIINTEDAPQSPLFSQAVKAGPFVYISGLVGMDVRTGSLVGSTVQEQTRQALTNCRAVLEWAGVGLDDVVEVGILLTDPVDFAAMNEEYATWFPAQPPARYVAKLGVEIPGLLVSIRMTAFIG